MYNLIRKFIVLFLLYFCNNSFSQSTYLPPPAPAGFNIISHEFGVTLYKRIGEDTYIQRIELDKGAKLKFLLGNLNNSNCLLNTILTNQEGRFGGNNPAIHKQKIEDFLSDFTNNNNNVFSVVNGSFFNCELRDNLNQIGSIFGSLGGGICENAPLFNLLQCTKLSFPLKTNNEVIGGDYGNSLPYDLKSLELMPNNTCRIRTFCTKPCNNSIDINSSSFSTEMIVGKKISDNGSITDGQTAIGVKGNNQIFILSSVNTSNSNVNNYFNDFDVDDFLVLDGGGSSKLYAKAWNDYQPFVLCPFDGLHNLLDCGREIPQAIGVTSGNISLIRPLYLNLPIEITPSNITTCSNLSINVNVKNVSDLYWNGKIYISLHNINGDFLRDILVQPLTSAGIPPGESTVLQITTPVSSIPELLSGNLYKIYVKYQTNGTNNYPLVGANNWSNPVTIAINNSSTCVNIYDIPPGNYSKIEMYGLNINPNTNDLEFMFRGYPALAGQSTVNIQQECATLKKIFKQALVTPSHKQWISIAPTVFSDYTSGNYTTVEGVAALPFRNTEMANRMFWADMYLKEFWSASFRVGVNNYWKSLVQQSPYWNSLRQKGYNNYAFMPSRAAIIPGKVSLNSSTSSIQVNSALIDVESSNFNTPYIHTWYMDLANLSQNERRDLDDRLQILNSWYTVSQTNREPSVRTLLNNHFAFNQIRQIYTTIALAKYYKTWNINNKPLNNSIDGENMNGISDVPVSNQIIDNFWHSCFSIPNIFTVSVPYNDFQNNSRLLTYGGCNMGRINPTDSGVFDMSQLLRDSIVFKDKGRIIGQDSSVYFYGGILETPIADLSGIINMSNTTPILDDTVQVQATIFNLGNIQAQQVKVRLYEQYRNNQNQLQNILIGEKFISSVDSFGVANTNFIWKPLIYGSKNLLLTIDEGNSILEKRKNNNTYTDSVFVLNNIPIVKIIEPVNGSALAVHNIEFYGNVYDNREGYLNTSDISWTSSIDGFLGNGSYISVDSLSVGNHVITLSATNSNGKIAFDYINIYVYPQGYPIVQILSPASGIQVANNASVALNGRAFDADEGDLCSTAIWTSNVQGTLGTGCTILRNLNLGAQEITLSATNNAGNTSVSSVTIQVVDGKPNLTISSPLNNSTYFQHQPITFTGSAIDFPQGNISSSIKWYSNIQGYLGTGADFSKLLQPGVHTITAYIQDNNGDSDTVIINNIAINLTPPVAYINIPTSSQTFDYLSNVRFKGGANDIQDGFLHGSHLKWYSSIQGFLGVGDSLNINTLQYGNHTIQLKATDNDGAESIANVSNIFIDAGQPIASITTPPNNTNSFYGYVLKLKGTANDPQDGILHNTHLKWYSNLDGFIGEGDSLILNNLSSGIHTLTLEATDNNGFIGKAIIKHTIEPPHPPSISIYYPFNNNHFIHGSVVTFKVSATDYEEGILNNNRISWTSSTNGNLGTGKIINVTNLSSGSHIITARAIDTTGLIATASIQIFIDQQKPVVQIITPASGLVFSEGTNITFTGTSFDYEDGILTGSSLKWSSDINGILGIGNSINASTLTVGSHLIKLVATDSQNAKDSSTIVIIIQKLNTILLNKFSGNKDSIVATFAIEGGDTTVYFNLPKSAKVISAQYTIIGDSVPFSSVEYLFAKRMGSSLVGQILQSKYGSIYSVGYGGYGTFDNVTQPGNGPSFFVAKQNNKGNVQWVKSYPIGGNPIFYNESKGHIVEDSQGNLYAYGSFRWSVNFGCDSFTNCSAYDAFILKLDSNGNCLWTKHIYSGTGGGVSEDFASNLTIDNSGSLYITGELNNDGLGYIGNYSFTLDGGFSGFIAKLDLSGNVIWERNLGNNRGSAVKVDDNLNAYVCGHSGSAWFDNIYFTSQGGADAFLAKYNLLGVIQWVVGGGGSSADEAYDLFIDSLNNIHTVGLCTGNGTWGSTNVNGHGSYDFFISKHDMNGNLMNINVGGGSGQDVAYTIYPFNDKYYVGGYWQSSDFNIDTLLFTNGISNNSIIIKQNLNGSSLSGFKIINGTTGNVTLNSLQPDINGNLILGGAVSGTLGNINLSGNGGFVAKRNNNPSQYPLNAFTDVFLDSNKEWNYNGYFRLINNSNNFALNLNTYLSNANSNNVSVPILIHSDSAGIIYLKYLNVQYKYADTIKPKFISTNISPNPIAKNSSFNIKTKVTDNQKVANVKAKFKNIIYSLNQVATDSFTVSILGDTVGIFPVILTVADTSGLTSDTTLFITIYSTTRDLSIIDNDVQLTASTYFHNDTGRITGVVKNLSNQIINNVPVVLKIDNQIVQTQTFNFSALGQQTVTYDWIVRNGKDSISIEIDPNNTLSETNRTNNKVLKVIQINDIYPPRVLKADATPNPAFVGDNILFKVKAIDTTGIQDIQVTWQSNTITLIYNSTTQYYEGTITASIIGVSNAVITVLDLNDLTTVTNLSVQVFQNLADLAVYSNDIQFTPAIGTNNSLTSLSIKVYNQGTIDANNSSVNVYRDGILLGMQTINVLEDSFKICQFNLPITCGQHLYKIIVDSANIIPEINDNNNSAIVTYQFCITNNLDFIHSSAIPNPVKIGQSFIIKSIVSNAASVSNIITNWNNNPYNLVFNTTNQDFERILTASSIGDFIIPVTAWDSNGNVLSDFIELRVVDSLPDIQNLRSTFNNYIVSSGQNTLIGSDIYNHSFDTLRELIVGLYDNGIQLKTDTLINIIPFDTIQQYFDWQASTGNHQLVIKADINNNYNENNEFNNTDTIAINVNDNQAPIIHEVNTTSPIYRGGSVTLGIYATDNEMVTNVNINLNNTIYTCVFDSISGLWSATLSTPDSSNQTLIITAYDNSGLSATASYSIYVNNNLPDIKVDALDLMYYPNIATNQIKVAVHNNGGGNAGLFKALLKIDNIRKDSVNISLLKGRTDTITFSFNGGYGLHNINIKADADSTISESNESNNIAVRNIFIPDFILPGIPIPISNPNTWTSNNNFNISWNSVNDNNGGVTYEYSIDGGSWANTGSQLSINVSVQEQGLHNVFVRAKDIAGNVSDPGVTQVRYDNIAPNKPILTEWHCDKHWTTHTSPYLEWINPGDIGSGIEYYETSIDNRSINNIGYNHFYHPTLNSGIHTLKVRAIDYAGNMGSWSDAITIYIDLDAPSCPVISSTTHPLQNKWYSNDSILLQWNKPTDLSSVIGYYYMINRDSIYHTDQTSYWSTKEKISISALPSMDSLRIRMPDGIWYFHIGAQDTVGNISDPSCSYKFMIDKTPPFTYDNHLDTVINCNYQFLLSAEDYHSGVALTRYRINNGSWIQDSIVTINTIGQNIIEYYSIDNAGNIESTDTSYVFVKNNLLQVNLGKDTSVCGNLTLIAPIGFNYLWSNGSRDNSVLIDSSQLVILELRDTTGCVFKDSIYVSVNPLPVSNFAYVIQNDSVFFSNLSSGANTYLWTFGDNDSSSLFAPYHHYSNGGQFIIMLKAKSDSCGESVYKDTLNYINTGVLNDPINETQILIYPNPVKNELTIQLITSKSNLEYDFVINNTLGQDMKLNGKLSSYQKVQKLDISHFSAGNYFLIIRNGSFATSFKIVKIE